MKRWIGLLIFVLYAALSAALFEFMARLGLTTFNFAAAATVALIFVAGQFFDRYTR